MRAIPQSYTLWNSSIILRYNQHTLSWAMHRRKKKKQLFLSSLLQPPPWLLCLLALQLHAQALTWLSSFTYGASGLWLLIWLPYSLNKIWSQLLNIPPNLSSVAICSISPLTQNETPRAFIQRICHFQDKPLLLPARLCHFHYFTYPSNDFIIKSHTLHNNWQSCQWEEIRVTFISFSWCGRAFLRTSISFPLMPTVLTFLSLSKGSLT